MHPMHHYLCKPDTCYCYSERNLMQKGGAHFSTQELAQVLSHYEIGIIQQIKPFTAGNMRAPKMVIVSDQGKFLLKRRSKGKDELYRVAFAHFVQSYLTQSGFPVAFLVPTRDENNTILRLDNHIYELFEFVHGSRYNGSAEATIDAGEQLAIFHRNLINFPSKFKPPRGSFHDSAVIRSHLKAIGSEVKNTNSIGELRTISETLMTLYNAASIRVNQLNFDSWQEQIIHGDWHPGNMLFCDNKVTAVLDFDSVKLAPPITDLANGMLQFSIVGGRPNPADWPDYLDQAKLIQFLAGYRKIIQLDEHRLNALLALMIETMIAEAVLPIAATGFFGNLSGSDFLKMICRKCNWIKESHDTLIKAVLA